VSANAADAVRLARQIAIPHPARAWPADVPSRGKILQPKVAVLRGGFVLPAIHGKSIAGATYDFD
jgi:hypothetical protein